MRRACRAVHRRSRLALPGRLACYIHTFHRRYQLFLVRGNGWYSNVHTSGSSDGRHGAAGGRDRNTLTRRSAAGRTTRTLATSVKLLHALCIVICSVHSPVQTSAGLQSEVTVYRRNYTAANALPQHSTAQLAAGTVCTLERPGKLVEWR